MRLRRAPTVVLAVALALGAAACVSGFDRNDQTVNSLRILGASMHVADTSPDCVNSGKCTDWADAETGDTVTFNALVANPTNVPNVTVTWLTCPPTSLNNPVTPCISEQALRDPTMLVGMPGVVTLGMGETIQYTIPDITALTNQLITRAQSPMTQAAQCSLFIEAPVIIIAQGTDAAGNPGPAVTALKYLRLSPWSQIGPYSTDPTLQAYVRNFNPSIDELNVAADQLPTAQSTCTGQSLVQSCTTDADCTNGGTCGADGWCTPVPFPAGPTTICGQIPDNDSQPFYYCGMDGVDGTQLEYPVITWYETAGAQAAVTNTNTTGTPTLPARTFLHFTRPSGPFTLYGVVRDGRDGENWIVQAFE